MDYPLQEPSSSDDFAARVEQRERRGKSRLEMPLRALVRGRSESGEAFELRTELKNLSASGLYMTLDLLVDPGAHLFVVVTMTIDERPAARIAIRGVVQRVETGTQDWHGIALRFTSYRYL